MALSLTINIMKQVIALLEENLKEYTNTLKYAEAAYAKEPGLLERYKKHYQPIINEFTKAIETLKQYEKAQ